MPVALANSLGDPELDAIVQSSIEIIEQAFPGKVRSYYITGSRVAGLHRPDSDLDLSIVFNATATGDDRAQADRLSGALNRLNRFAGFGNRHQTWLTPVNVVALKMNSMFLFGEDIREDLDWPDRDRYAYWVLEEGAQSFRRRARQSEYLSFPAAFPDPDDVFKGYFNNRGTREWVHAIFWAMTGLIGYRTREFVPHRHAGRDLYRNLIGDKWSNFFDEVDKASTGYSDPPEPGAAHDLLKDLCERTLDFENYFLGVYLSLVH